MKTIMFATGCVVGFAALTVLGVRDDFFGGDIWTLREIIREYEKMTEKLKKLKKHGIDLDGGTLSIRLWE